MKVASVFYLLGALSLVLGLAGLVTHGGWTRYCVLLGTGCFVAGSMTMARVGADEAKSKDLPGDQQAD